MQRRTGNADSPNQGGSHSGKVDGAGCFVTEQTTQALTADAQLTGQQTLIYVQLSISSERVYGVTVWSSHLGPISRGPGMAMSSRGAPCSPHHPELSLVLSVLLRSLL